MQTKKYEYHINDSDVGKRLYLFLREALADYSRNRIKSVIDSGGVYVNKKREFIASYPLKSNDFVEFYGDFQVQNSQEKGARSKDLQGKNFKLSKQDIVYEDNYILALNKPAGIPTQATYSSAKGTIIEYVEKYYAALGKNQYVRLIHRLDKGSSGVLIISKSPESNSELAEQFSGKGIKKEYLALVSGALKIKADTVKTFIAKAKGSHTKYENVSAGGKIAVSSYKVITEYNGYSLVQVKPETGRTHQIRLHLAHLGSPILGDDLYGGETRLLVRSKEDVQDINIGRVMLHAKSITLTHPKSKKKLQIDANIPDDMKNLMKTLSELK